MGGETGHYPYISPLSAGLRCRCPRCGQGRLYAGVLDVAAACGTCGLDLKGADAGDGPAVFVILILGFVVVGLAIWVEVAYEPPLWVHGLLWAPTIVIGSLVLLRVFKATLIALQYRHRADTLAGNG